MSEELDELASIRAPYDGDIRLPTAAAFSMGLHNAYHRDRGDVKDAGGASDPLAWTTILSIDLGAIAENDPCAYKPPRRNAKAAGRGAVPFEDEFPRFVDAHFKDHVAGRGGRADDDTTWLFNVNRAVAVDLRGRGGRGVFLRLKAGRHFHSTTLSTDSLHSDLLCGLALYSKAAVVGPMRKKRKVWHEALARESDSHVFSYVSDDEECLGDDLVAGAEDSDSDADTNDSEAPPSRPEPHPTFG